MILMSSVLLQSEFEIIVFWTGQQSKLAVEVNKLNEFPEKGQEC